MAKFKFFGIQEADAAFKAAESAINPLLTAAKITTIDVNGEPMAATSDVVPLALKITALAAVNKPGAGDQEMSQVLASNQILADQCKDLQTRLTIAETNAGTLTREKTSLETDLTTSKASVQTLTASNAELTNLRAAANAEAGRVITQMNGLNSELSRRCLSVGCLVDLRNGDNQLLPSTASAEDKQSAAERIPAAEKLTALCGAVNSALVRTGVDPANVPAAGPNGQRLNLSTKAVLDQYNAIKDPTQKTSYYREHKAAIDGAYDNKTD